MMGNASMRKAVLGNASMGNVYSHAGKISMGNASIQNIGSFQGALGHQIGGPGSVSTFF